MNTLWLLLVVLIAAFDVVAVSITANTPAQPQASATSHSITETAITSTTRNTLPTTLLFGNATALAPPSESACSANCNFTLPVENSGRWKRCVAQDEIYFAGHVKYIVDRLRNKTMTTTIYAGKVTYTINNTATTAEASDVMANGSFKYSRTDVNEAGTVTAIIQDYINKTHYEFAYPTAARDFGLETYSWEGVLPYATNSTTECITATDGPYSYPTNVVLPTRQVGQLDSGDPRGLSYCYDAGEYMPIQDDLFWSRFKGTLMEALHNESNCKQRVYAMAPVGVAMQATFLLETTTDFVDEPTPSPSTEADPTPTEVLADPFRVIPPSEDEQPSRSNSDVEPASSTVVEPVETKPAPDRTTSATKQSLKASLSPEDQSSPPLDDDNESGSSELRVTKPTAPAEEVSDSGDKPTASPKTSQLGALNSLIQAVGQQQSTVDQAAPASNNAPTLTLHGVTATPGSSSEYVLGEQTLKAGGPAVTISGTQISLASGASFVVIGSSTSVLVGSESHEDRVQTGNVQSLLTFAGATATLDSASEYIVADQTLTPGGSAITLSGTRISLAPDVTAVVIGSSTRALAVASPGIGDYVWAGIAGILAVAETSSTEAESDVVVTSTASDGGVVVKTISAAEPTRFSPIDSSSSSIGAPSFVSDDASLASSPSPADSPNSSIGNPSASGEASSTSSSSSAQVSDLDSGTTSTKSTTNVAVAMCCLVFFVMCGS